MTACADCGADNDAAASTCSSCGATIDNPAARALIGQVVLGVYELVDVIGKGGMSVVYKARHKLTEQMVALKILPAELAVHSDIKARFVEEAKALARLEHPNIVRLYNFGEEGGRFVLAMQYVDGTTFERRILSAGRLDWQQAAGVVCQVLAALDYAHRRGIIHRDIKPSNVLVRPDGSAMVMDFGIAKMAEGSSRLTATGQTMGTVRYMSPEQVRGKVVDHRSDLYSVGATLYEAVVGDTPFDGSTHFEIMMKHLNEPPPSLRAHLGAGDAPEALDRVLTKALAKNPRMRYQTAAAFLEDLEAILDHAGAEVPGAGRPTREREAEPATIPFLPAAGSSGDLAGVLEPEPVALLPRRRRRGRAYSVVAVGGALVIVAGMAVMVLGRGRTPPASAVPEPFLVGGLRPVVDHRFAGVRVLSARAVDPDKLAAAYAAATRRFAAWVADRTGITIETPPVNLVVAPAATMCEKELHQSALPEDCLARPPHFAYPPRRATLYVLDNEALESINLVEAASAHLCINTPALLERGCMRNFLPPYWDEVERR